jgi:hypothetical protein
MKLEDQDALSATSESTPADQTVFSESAEIRPRIVLTNQQARDIFQLKSGHGFASLHSASIRLASKYGVSSKAIRDIWKGRSWLEATFDLWNVEDRPAKRIIGRPKGKKDSKPRLRGSSTKCFGEKESSDTSSRAEYSHGECVHSAFYQGREFQGQGHSEQHTLLPIQTNSYPHYPSSFNAVGIHDSGAFAGRVSHPSPYGWLPSIGCFPQNNNTFTSAAFDTPLQSQLQPMSMMCGSWFFGAGILPPISAPLTPASSTLSLLGIELLTQRLLGIAADNLAHSSLPATRPAICH